MTVGIETYIILALAGVLAGVVNAIAGGGTFFTFPVLIWVGLPPLVANTTNMVALLPANLVALAAYRPQLRHLGRKCLGPMILAALGGTLGATMLLVLGAQVFAGLVPYLIGFSTILFATAPRLRRAVLAWGRNTGQSWPILPILVFFAFTVYGGYFGAGLGQIMLAALILIGFDDLHEANTLKNLVVFSVSLVAVVVFGFGGSVSWHFALVMMVSSSIGGYLGGRLALTVPQSALRVAIICFGLFLTSYYALVGI
ncbi:hypothetical protein SAMN05444000_103237 [Shimia gijangensis]|uniref:Probable membrane transporter protein n=1 Tax=Shimia gijangensis TaxID=1470563 RepID=A0A1M6ELH5_9RHOB|nr:sulfite exporter TauE/SafE family protein [Shimia gijangensis]SHI86347.1 hypothetical protein SAMN05444000_103237 [Shimia gijangensis]